MEPAISLYWPISANHPSLISAISADHHPLRDIRQDPPFLSAFFFLVCFGSDRRMQKKLRRI